MTNTLGVGLVHGAKGSLVAFGLAALTSIEVILAGNFGLVGIAALLLANNEALAQSLMSLHLDLGHTIWGQ